MAARFCRSRCGKLRDHTDWAVQVDLNFAGNVVQVRGERVQVDLAHDPGVVDQHVQAGKLACDALVKARDSDHVAYIALDCMNARQALPRDVEPRLAAAGDNHGVVERQKPPGQLEADSRRSAGYQNRIPGNPHARHPRRANGRRVRPMSVPAQRAPAAGGRQIRPPYSAKSARSRTPWSRSASYGR